MLAILQGKKICNVLVIVTRYFGGILLGTGGLVRAYSEATINVIEKSKKAKICQGQEYKIKLEYSELESFKYYCIQNEISINNIEYLKEVECIVNIKEQQIEKFLDDIQKRKIKISYNEFISKKLIKFKI